MAERVGFFRRWREILNEFARLQQNASSANDFRLASFAIRFVRLSGFAAFATASRVEEKRGGVQDRRRRRRARSFVPALAEWTIAPVLLPAHRTGRADFPHPALGRVSRQGRRKRE